jgi:hypothetical protein
MMPAAAYSVSFLRPVYAKGFDAGLLWARRSFSEGGKQGPIRRGGRFERGRSLTFAQRPSPVVMGPGFRRDDG